MEGSYPILINGVQTGTLTVAREGLMTTFLAECADPGWLVRLAVYGPEGTGYLGVMIPEGGRLRLKKRLSRAALAGFPKQLSFAGPAGMETSRPEAGQAQPEPTPEQAPAPPAAEAAPTAPAAERETPAEAPAVPAAQAAEPVEQADPAPAEPPAAAEPEAAAPPVPPAEPQPEPPKQSAPRPASPRRVPTLPPVPEAPGDINWFATPEGILVGTDGKNELVAIEADDVRLGVHGRGVLRRIEGKNYMIFKAHNGVASIR